MAATVTEDWSKGTRTQAWFGVFVKRRFLLSADSPRAWHRCRARLPRKGDIHPSDCRLSLVCRRVVGRVRTGRWWQRRRRGVALEVEVAYAAIGSEGWWEAFWYPDRPDLGIMFREAKRSPVAARLRGLVD